MIKFIVEYETTPIRFATVICPNCEKGFDAKWYGKTEDGGHIHDDVDLQFGKFKCPECKHKFSTRDKQIEIDGR